MDDFAGGGERGGDAIDFFGEGVVLVGIGGVGVAFFEGAVVGHCGLWVREMVLRDCVGTEREEEEGRWKMKRKRKKREDLR